MTAGGEPALAQAGGAVSQCGFEWHWPAGYSRHRLPTSAKTAAGKDFLRLPVGMKSPSTPCRVITVDGFACLLFVGLDSFNMS